MAARKPPRNTRELMDRARESIGNINLHRQAMRDVAATVRPVAPPQPPLKGAVR
jgi:hypothetical protein